MTHSKPLQQRGDTVSLESALTSGLWGILVCSSLNLTCSTLSHFTQNNKTLTGTSEMGRPRFHFLPQHMFKNATQSRTASTGEFERSLLELPIAWMLGRPSGRTEIRVPAPHAEEEFEPEPPTAWRIA